LISFITDKIIESIDPSALSESQYGNGHRAQQSADAAAHGAAGGTPMGVLGSISDSYRRYFKLLSDLLLHGAISVEAAFQYSIPRLLSTVVS
jgi:hypothetical protein